MSRTASASTPDTASLGIDIGTQSAHAVLLDGAGHCLGRAAASLRAADERNDGRHVQHPDAWWAASCGATRQALAGLDGRDLTAVAIAATSGTVLVQDRDGAARGPALMYDDGRAVAQAERAQRIGAAAWRRLGYRMQPTWALPKVLWFLEHGELAAGDRLAHQADHIAGRLAGHPVAADTSHALKTGADPIALDWPTETLSALGLDSSLLPPVVPPGATLGVVSVAAAAATAIPAGTPIRAGMTDGCAAQIAAAALRPGSWSSALGTTLICKGSTRELLHDEAGAVYCHRNPDGGWLPGGASSAGAGVLSRDFAGADLAALTRAAARFEPAPGVLYPLTGQGERFPFRAPTATGFSTVPGSDPATRFAAILQGVAFVERLCLAVFADLGADISGPITLTGGASVNDYWNQLRTDIIGRPTRIPESAEPAAGMAILAAAPPGQLTATAERMVRISREFAPDPERGRLFAATYQDFLRELRDRGWLAPERAGQAIG
jgi:sugar (pentulose or hexulose) kinase